MQYGLASCSVVVCVYVPAIVGDEDEGVEDVADHAVERRAVGEAPVATEPQNKNQSVQTTQGITNSKSCKSSR